LNSSASQKSGILVRSNELNVASEHALLLPSHESHSSAAAADRSFNSHLTAIERCAVNRSVHVLQHVRKCLTDVQPIFIETHSSATIVIGDRVRPPCTCVKFARICRTTAVMIIMFSLPGARRDRVDRSDVVGVPFGRQRALQHSTCCRRTCTVCLRCCISKRHSLSHHNGTTKDVNDDCYDDGRATIKTRRQ
jgi:hypothetical protein